MIEKDETKNAISFIKDWYREYFGMVRLGKELKDAFNKEMVGMSRKMIECSFEECSQRM